MESGEGRDRIQPPGSRARGRPTLLLHPRVGETPHSIWLPALLLQERAVSGQQRGPGGKGQGPPGLPPLGPGHNGAPGLRAMPSTSKRVRGKMG